MEQFGWGEGENGAILFYFVSVGDAASSWPAAARVRKQRVKDFYSFRALVCKEKKGETISFFLF